MASESMQCNILDE